MGMRTVRERAVENATEITSMLVLGAGFIALFIGFSPIPFWAIFAVGFAVVVPIVAILAGDEEKSDWNWWHQSNDDWWHDFRNGTLGRSEYVDRTTENGTTDESTTDALSTLRDRYARGDLTDEQFERKLDALLETESPESAAEWRTRERDRRGERERIQERS